MLRGWVSALFEWILAADQNCVNEAASVGCLAQRNASVLPRTPVKTSFQAERGSFGMRCIWNVGN